MKKSIWKNSGFTLIRCLSECIDQLTWRFSSATLFVENGKQIQAELKSCNIPISFRQIGYLSKKFVVAMGGSVTAANNTGQGCTISISMPF